MNTLSDAIKKSFEPQYAITIEPIGEQKGLSAIVQEVLWGLSKRPTIKEERDGKVVLLVREK